MSRQYGHPDEIAARRSPEAREARYTAILDVLAGSTEVSWTPNEIGSAIKYRHGIDIPRTHGHSGKVLGYGSAISPTLRAMDKRGWITWGSRPDGLSGTAYRITSAGREELARRTP